MNNIQTNTDDWQILTKYSNEYMECDNEFLLKLPIKKEKQNYYEKTVGD